MRLIDADELIKDIDYSADMGGALGKVVECVKYYAKYMVASAPTIERKRGKWIPCRECLPEKSGKYLVTVQNGNVYAGTYDKYSGRFQCAATAWMELPAPYQEDD